MAQTAEHQIQISEVLGSVLIGVAFCCWIVLFSRGKAFGANIANLVSAQVSSTVLRKSSCVRS